MYVRACAFLYRDSRKVTRFLIVLRLNASKHRRYLTTYKKTIILSNVVRMVLEDACMVEDYTFNVYLVIRLPVYRDWHSSNLVVTVM